MSVPYRKFLRILKMFVFRENVHATWNDCNSEPIEYFFDRIELGWSSWPEVYRRYTYLGYPTATSCSFRCSTAKTPLFVEIWRKMWQLDEASGASELRNVPKQASWVHCVCLRPLYKQAACGLLSWLGLPGAFGCYSLNMVTCYNRNERFVAKWDSWYVYLR